MTNTEMDIAQDRMFSQGIKKRLSYFNKDYIRNLNDFPPIRPIGSWDSFMEIKAYIGEYVHDKSLRYSVDHFMKNIPLLESMFDDFVQIDSPLEEGVFIEGTSIKKVFINNKTGKVLLSRMNKSTYFYLNQRLNNIHKELDLMFQ